MPGDVGWFFEEVLEGVELAEAELEGEEAAGLEGGVGGGEEAAVDVEAVRSGEEGGVGFVLEDFVGQGGGFVEGDVRGVRDDDVEGCEGLNQERGEEVGLDEGDAVGEVVTRCVLLSNGERRRVEIGGSDAGGGKPGSEGERDGAGAGTDVEDVGIAEVGVVGDPAKDSFDEELGFGAGDESVGSDVEHEAEEFLVAGDVLDGFFGDAAGDEGAVGFVEAGREFGVGVGDEPGAVVEEEMGEEGFGLAAIDGGGGFGEGFAEGHKGRV